MKPEWKAGTHRPSQPRLQGNQQRWPRTQMLILFAATIAFLVLIFVVLKQ